MAHFVLNFDIFCFTWFSISWNTAAWMHRILWCINPNARLIWDASNKIWLWCICIMCIILCLIVLLHHRRWCTCWWGWRCCRSWRASDNKATIARWCATGASANASLVHPGPPTCDESPERLLGQRCCGCHYPWQLMTTNDNDNLDIYISSSTGRLCQL